MMLRAREAPPPARSPPSSANATSSAARDADLRTRLEAFADGARTPKRLARPRPRTSKTLAPRPRHQGQRHRHERSRPPHRPRLPRPHRQTPRPRQASAWRTAAARRSPKPTRWQREDYLAIAALDGAGANAKIHQAAPLTLADIEDLFAAHIETREVIEWSSRDRAVIAREEERLHALTLAERPLKKPDPRKARRRSPHRHPRTGLAHRLPWTHDLETLPRPRRLRPQTRTRRRLARPLRRSAHRDRSKLASTVPRQRHPRRRLSPASTSRPRSTRCFDWEKKKRLDNARAHAHRRAVGLAHPIDYSADAPILAVRLQEMFGLADTPTVGERPRPADAASALARPPPRASHARPQKLLEERLSRRETRPQRPLPQTPLARRPLDRNPDRPRQTARDMSAVHR